MQDPKTITDTADNLPPETQSQALPKYIQISEMLIRDIAAGHLVDGARLPPERDMAAGLGISVGTLRKSLADLANKGLLDRVQGSGNYVRHRPVVQSLYAFFRLELVRGGGLPTAKVISVARMAKPQGTPDFGPAHDAHRIRRLRYLGDTLIAVEEIWLDGNSATAIAKSDLSESLYHYYRVALGLIIAAVTDEVGLGAVPDWAPQAFPLPPGQTCGYIERVSRDATGGRVEFSRTWFDADKARYVSRMGRG